ncbi:hypothetical protein DU055_14070 [Salmonella enterica subsp. enterica serovar Hofit]|uniref:Uncharacterized protein n=1 Tax=Salmonella enterica subsp. enterica serovar Hofit TaxID=2564537 RepID=A0A5W8MEJ4_SALET|nr:hypothetical protein [Salmonella enterica subsp. enterica serovar Hofit]
MGYTQATAPLTSGNILPIFYVRQRITVVFYNKSSSVVLILVFCNAVNNFGLMCNQFWIAILATHDPELSISVLTPAL